MLETAEAGACLRIAPGRWIVARGPFRRAAAVPPGEVAFYRNDFAVTVAEPWFVPAAAWETTQVPPPGSDDVEVAWRPLAREGFESILETVLAGLRANRWRKAVLAVPETGRLIRGDVAILARRALRHREAAACWPYVFRDGDGGCAGMTPETLFTVRGNRLHTMALAGTARSAEQADFEHDTKQIREHEIVVETLRSKLGDWGEVKTGPREVLNIGGLIHFITRFEVGLTGTVETDALVHCLHPTPAMGILPRTAENLASLQAWRRHLGVPESFGAPLGVQWAGGVHMVVTIRGLWWQGDEITLPAGCGIVEGSALEREWRELGLKRRWVKQSFGLDG